MTTIQTDLKRQPAAKTPFTPTADIPKSDMQSALQYVAENGGGGGGGSGAPTDSQYLVSSSDGGLDNERVVQDTATIVWDFSGLGTASASVQLMGLQDLTDPGGDRGLFWDDSEGKAAFFTAGTGLGFEGTNLSITHPLLVAMLEETGFTLGDLLYHDGAGLVRLPAGTDGQVLRTRGDALPPDWVNIAGGGDMLAANNLSDVTNAATARNNLGVEIGTDVQAYDATLQSLSALGTAADKIAYTTGVDTWAETALSAFGRTLIDDADASAARTTLGLAIGTNVQAYDADLSALAGLTSAANKLPYFTGSATAALADLTAFGRSLVDDADAATARSTLGLVIGTDVQAYSAVLAGATASFTTAQETKLGHITVTQAVDLDAIESRVNQLDASVVLSGTWDASGGTFPGGGTAQAGQSYIVSVGGTVDGVAFTANDRIVAILDNASTTTYASNWHKLDYTDAVLSVAGRTGAVTLSSSDLTDVTAFARTLIDDADAATARGTLGLTIGTNVQAYDATLAALAGVTTAADKLIYATGVDTFTTADLTVAGRSMVGAASAAAQTALLSAFVGDSGSGGTKGLVPAPVTGDATKFLRGDGTFQAITAGDAVTTSPLSQFAATTSAQLRGVLSDETGTGLAYFQGGDIGTPSAGVLTNCTGLPTAGILDDAITYAKIQNVTANGVLARAAATDGDVSAVTLAASRLLGRGSTGDVAAISLGTGLTMSGTTLSGGREVLTAARTYYVRTDGSDSNNGLANTSGGAFLTIQKAINTVLALDISIYDVTIAVASGTYTGANTIPAPFVGSGFVTISGTSATVSTTSASAFLVSNGASIILSGLTLQTTTSGNCIHAAGGAKVALGASMVFGACAGTAHMVSQGYAYITADVNYTISGAAARHLYCDGASIFCGSSRTITVSGTPAFSDAFVVCLAAGNVLTFGNTYSGAATGSRYKGTLNGIINTFGGGASYFPGNSAGTTATGAQYA